MGKTLADALNNPNAAVHRKLAVAREARKANAEAVAQLMKAEGLSHEEAWSRLLFGR